MTRHDSEPTFFDPSYLIDHNIDVFHGALTEIDEVRRNTLLDCSRMLIKNMPDIYQMTTDERKELAANSKALSPEAIVEASDVLFLCSWVARHGRVSNSELSSQAHAQYYPASNSTSINTVIREHVNPKNRTLLQSPDASSLDITLEGLEKFERGAESTDFSEAYLSVIQYRLRALSLGSNAVKALAYIDGSIPKVYKDRDMYTTLFLSDAARQRLVDPHEVQRLQLSNVNTVKASVNYWVTEGCVEGKLMTGPLGISGIGRACLHQLRAIYSIKPNIADVTQPQPDVAQAVVPAEILAQVARVNAGLQYLRGKKRGKVPADIDPRSKFAGIESTEIASAVSSLAQLEETLSRRFGVPKGVFKHASAEQDAA